MGKNLIAKISEANSVLLEVKEDNLVLSEVLTKISDNKVLPLANNTNVKDTDILAIHGLSFGDVVSGLDAPDSAPFAELVLHSWESINPVTVNRVKFLLSIVRKGSHRKVSRLGIGNGNKSPVTGNRHGGTASVTSMVKDYCRACGSIESLLILL